MKVLNLYAGAGGNRKLWKGCEVTAVEIDPAIAAVYKKAFPKDTVLVEDAHAFLLNNFHRFEFIWSSPPCPSHGQYRFNVGVRAKGFKPLFPDLQLYEEILFLQHHAKARWVVENVKPYYTPLIAPSAVLQRHLFWSNFSIPDLVVPAKDIRSKNKVSDYADLGIDLAGSGVKNKRQVLRNCVDSKLGAHILRSAMRTAPK